MTVSFIPVYTDYLVHRSTEESQELVDVAFTLASSALMGLAVFGIIFRRRLSRPWPRASMICTRSG